MTINELHDVAEIRAENYRIDAMFALEKYMEKYDSGYPLWDMLNKIYDDIHDNNYMHVMDDVHELLADGYYADDLLVDYNKVRKVYATIRKYVTYSTIQNSAEQGIKNLKKI